MGELKCNICKNSFSPVRAKLVCVPCNSMYHGQCSSGTKVSYYKKLLIDGIVDIESYDNRQFFLMPVHLREHVFIRLVEEVNQMTTYKITQYTINDKKIQGEQARMLEKKQLCIIDE